MSVLWIGQPDPRPERPAAEASSLAVEFPYTPAEPVSRRGRHRKAGRVSHRSKAKSRLARIAPIAAVLPVTAFLTITTLPRLASAASSVMFYVVDNGGVLVTSQQLHPGETIFHAGVAYRVVSTHPLGSHTEFRAIPAVTSSGVFSARG